MEVDFRLIEFEFDLFDWDDKLFLSWRNATIIVFDIVKLLISDFRKYFFVDIRVHVDQLLANDFIYAR